MPDKVKLPSIKELTSGLSTNNPTTTTNNATTNTTTTSVSTPALQLTSSPPSQHGFQQQKHQIRHASLGSSTGTSPQQIYYHHPTQSNSQPSVLLPASTIPSTNSSISSASSIMDSADQLLGGVASRKSSTSITPPYQSVTFPPQNTGNYIITNPQFDMLNYKIQQTHPINPFEQLQQQQQQYHNYQPIHHHQPPQQQQQPTHHHQQHFQHLQQATQPKKKRPRRKANEMERLYACNYKSCKNSYGTLNHLNAHITFKRHGPKRKPEEFKQIRELYKLKKTKLDELAKREKNSEGGGIKLLANLSESLLDNETRNDLINSSSSTARSENSSGLLKNDITDLPIYHQQRGYNGYGRHSYTLKQGG